VIVHSDNTGSEVHVQCLGADGPRWLTCVATGRHKAGDCKAMGPCPAGARAMATCSVLGHCNLCKAGGDR